MSRSERRIESTRDRIEDELDMGDALAREGPRVVGQIARIAGQRRDAGLLGSPDGRPEPPGMPDQDGDGALDLGRVAADVAAGVVDEVRGRPRCPPGRFPMSTYQAFHASAWAIVARSIRGPIEPIISGGPGRRADRAAAARSRGPGTSVHRSRWRPRAEASG